MHLLFVWLFSLLVVPVALASGGSILILGDSLSAAYGLPRQAGWVTLLEERLRQGKFNYRVINASVSGETSAGGASRISSLLRQHKPEIVILALGGNDGLRGLPTTQLASNLETMIRSARQGNAKVLLVGMRMPPNFGPAYTRRFEAVYADLARRHRTAFVPFLLEGFADRPEYFLPDGIHPNAAAQPLILDRVWTALAPLLRN
jgi:acyl-CoA thioesterase-1